jgi:hypothetical protein
MTDLDFIEDLHIYRLGEESLPSPTLVLQHAGFYSTGFFTEEGRKRGSYVHKACEMYDNGELNLASSELKHIGYINAWIKFRQEYGFEPLSVEERMFHPTYRYGFTTDRVGMMRGHEDSLSLLDIKTGAPDPATIFQMASYKEGLRANDIECEHTFVVYLQADGKYKLTQLKPTRADLYMFLSLLGAFNWRKENGRL